MQDTGYYSYGDGGKGGEGRPFSTDGAGDKGEHALEVKLDP